MKRLNCLVLTLILVANGADTYSQDGKDVLAAMDSLKQAVLNKDRTVLERLLHTDLTYTHSSGKTENKAEAIQGIVGANGTQNLDFSESKVRVYNNAALVTGKVTLQPSTGGKAGSPSVLYISHTWIKGPQGWQLVNRQATRPAPAP